MLQQQERTSQSKSIIAKYYELVDQQQRPAWMKIQQSKRDFAVEHNTPIRFRPVQDSRFESYQIITEGDPSRGVRNLLIPTGSMVRVLCDGSWYIANVIDGVTGKHVQLAMRSDGRLYVTGYRLGRYTTRLMPLT